MQAVYSLLKFEPRQVRHRSVPETVRMLFPKETEGVHEI